MKYISLIILVLIIASCNDDKQEVVNLEDIMPTSENYKDGPKENDTSNSQLAKVNTGLDVTKLEEQKIVFNNIATSDSLLFPDRFSPIHLNKFVYSIENEQILFSSYRFKDLVKTKNVFLNWTNCFGTKCKALRIGESNNLQRDGFLLLSNDTSIIYVASNSVAEQKKWITYYTKEKDIQWRYILTQSKGGKVKWNTFRENKLAPIEDKFKIQD